MTQPRSFKSRFAEKIWFGRQYFGKLSAQFSPVGVPDRQLSFLPVGQSSNNPSVLIAEVQITN
jgi:hypothetical protein